MFLYNKTNAQQDSITTADLLKELKNWKPTRTNPKNGTFPFTAG